MPLQIRRGTDAEKNAMTIPLAPGELLWVTDDKKLYVGDGVTSSSSLAPVSGFGAEEAIDAAASALVSGVHNGITFTYGATQDLANRIDANIDLSNYSGTIKADFKGSVFADDGSTIGGTVLVDGTDGSINLNGTIKNHVVPGTNDIYDLGTSAVRFNDLYLGGSIVIGGAIVNSVLNTVDLPAGSTIGGVNIQTSVSQDEAFLRDIKGSVFGDDSTVIIDSIESSVNTSGLKIIGTSIYNQDAYVSMNIGTTSSPTTVNFFLDESLELKMPVSAVTGRYVTFTQNRGTLTSPTAVQAGDILGGMLMKGYTNTSSSGIVGNISFLVDPTSSVTSGSGYIKGQLVFSCASDTGVDAANVAGLDSSGQFQVHHLTATKWIQNAVYANDAARSAAIPSPVQGSMVFMQSGTTPAVTNKLVVYDGSAWVALH